MKYVFAFLFAFCTVCVQAQEFERVGVALFVGTNYLDRLIETEDERYWAGSSRWEFGHIVLQYRLHEHVFVAAEGAMFKRIQGTDYDGQNPDHFLLALGGDYPLPGLFSRHPQHSIRAGVQVEYGRTGGGSERFRNWVWLQGGTVTIAYSGGCPISGLLRAVYRHHTDSDGSGSGLRMPYRLWGVHVGLQYRFWKR